MQEKNSKKAVYVPNANSFGKVYIKHPKIGCNLQQFPRELAIGSAGAR
jgi:hypothetical protein